MRDYLLAIERNHNDYIPIDRTVLSEFVNRSVVKLDEIDSFTNEIPEDQIKLLLYKNNIIGIEDFGKKFVIIFEEKNKKRKLAWDIINEGELQMITPPEISNFIIKNISNKNAINKIYNYFKDKNVSDELSKFLYALKNSRDYSLINLLMNLDQLLAIPYEERRELGLFINRILIPSIDMEDEYKLLKKEESHE